mmetsp:Transcript_16040/g.33303  ORF Transcript_16040/g.33303 Transcript_16040/m.33303 type:complete len:291 (+) Transcript_16040:602-1474(+)
MTTTMTTITPPPTTPTATTPTATTTNPPTSTSTSTSPTRKVYFSQDDQEVNDEAPARAGVRVSPGAAVRIHPRVRVHLIPSLWDMDEDELLATWYTHREMRTLRRAAVLSIKRMMAGTLDEDKDNDTIWGLENKIPKTSILRRKNRCAALFAVFDEQAKQREQQNRHQPVQAFESECIIAELYHQTGAHCQIEANKTAANVAKFVREEREQGEQVACIVQALTPTSTAVDSDVAIATVAAAIQLMSIDENLHKRKSMVLSPTLQQQRPSLSRIVSPHGARSHRLFVTMMT